MPRKERKRASKPKVKTGCRTCKIRHVKCDEGRPECIRCRKAGFDCDGYPDPSIDFSERAILPKCGQAFADWMADLEPNSGLFVKLPWGSLFQTESEYRYFEFFQSKTASQLSGYFDNDVWGRLILQACEHEEFARHGVLALAALNKTIEAISAQGGTLATDESNHQIAIHHHEVALKHYAKSLRLMRQRTADVRDEYHLRNLLVSCLLTVCFENYHGNKESALAQAVSGIKLLSQFQEQKSFKAISIHSPLSTGLSVIDPNLIDAFVRLEIVVMMGRDPIPEQRDLSLQVQQATKALANMPSEFKTVKEARYYLDIMIRRTIHCFHEEGLLPTWRPFILRKDVSTSDLSLDTKPSTLDQYRSVEAQWFHSFSPLLNRLRANEESRDFRGALVLMIQFLVARLLHPTTSDSQVITDADELVQLSKEVLTTPNDLTGGPSNEPVFAFDGNLLSPLFVVATRCRILHIRRDAIALLKSNPRREGFWDSEMAARVAEWFVDTEEEELQDDEEISPNKRLVLISNKFVLAERKTTVRCARQVNGEATEILEPVLLRW